VSASVLILGCGYVGGRVARRLLDRGLLVHATSREPEALGALAARGAVVHELDVCQPAHLAALTALGRQLPGTHVLHSIPPVDEDGTVSDPTPRLVRALGGAPARIVYLSTTGVYGDAPAVDEDTAAAPRTERGRLRLRAEAAVAAGPWTTLCLRLAAIYGPGRGVHQAVLHGRFRAVGAGRHVVSRIHVDDLAALVVAALLTGVAGAFPVADDEPAASEDVAALAARLLDCPMPAAGTGPLHETLAVDRTVDGRAIRRLLGVALQYPSYRVGIPAVLAAEAEGLTTARRPRP
jgi:nucleoside-diphosphate-sugar epimerase